MASEPSKTQIDKLGDRLKKGNIAEDDLRLLDEYRLSFLEAYGTVVGVIQNQLELEPTGRPAKSTTSISEKLHRESIRLTQIQDISGCRLVVSDVAAQDSVVKSLAKVFNNVTVVDRRSQPSHGYRAVHLIVKLEDKLIEIQLRTALQHLWAEMSEKLSDIIEPAIKYGGGGKKIQQHLTNTSALVAKQEFLEIALATADAGLSGILVKVDSSVEHKILAIQKVIEDLQRQGTETRQGLTELLQKTTDHVAELTGENDDIPD